LLKAEYIDYRWIYCICKNNKGNHLKFG